MISYYFVYLEYVSLCASLPPGEDEGRSEGRLFSRNTLAPPPSVGPASPLVRRKKKRDLMEVTVIHHYPCQHLERKHFVF